MTVSLQNPAWCPRLDATLRAEDVTPIFRQLGRIHLPGFLEAEDAALLYRTLASERDWVCSTMNRQQAMDVPTSAIEAMEPARRAEFMAAVHADAAASLGQAGALHYMFDTVRIDTALAECQAVNPVYEAFYRWMNSAPFLDFIRRMTGDPRCNFIDARATRFMPGHYLTQHDDSHPGRSRLYAYVMNLTPRWHPDWGGMLNFIDADGHLAEAYAPRMNAFNIFTVPQSHAVSYVTPFAAAPRYSITGWIRSDILSVK